MSAEIFPDEAILSLASRLLTNGMVSLQLPGLQMQTACLTNQNTPKCLHFQICLDKSDKKKGIVGEDRDAEFGSVLSFLY